MTYALKRFGSETYPQSRSVNVYPGAGQISVADSAALTALPTAGLATGTLAFVRSRGTYWSYQPESEGPASGMAIVAQGGGFWEYVASGTANDAQQVVSWYVSPASGSDDNAGTSADAPLKTKNEIIRRWGTHEPVLSGQAFSITYLSSDTDSSDPGDFRPTLTQQASLTHTAPLPAPSFVGTLGAVTPNNPAGNQALQATFVASSGAVAANLLLVNATRGGSRAWVQRNVSGGTWQLTQPLTPYSGSGFPESAQVNTWAEGDEVSGYALVAVDLVRLGGLLTEFTASFGNAHLAYQLAFYSAGASSLGDNLIVADTTTVFLAECAVARDLSVENISTVTPQISNCAVSGATSQVKTATMYGGYVTSPYGQWDLLDNVIVQGGASLFGPEIFLEGVAIDGTVDTFGNPTVFVNDDPEIDGAIYACNGVGTYDQASGVAYYFGSATDIFAVPTLLVGRQSTAYSVTTAGGVATIYGPIALSGPNLDAAAGAAGFGGFATSLGGASIQSA